MSEDKKVMNNLKSSIYTQHTLQRVYEGKRGRDLMSEDKKVMNDLKSSIYTQLKKEYKRCFWPKSNCTQNCIIRAHSIQNGQILDQIASNNHVVMAVHKLNLNPDTAPEIEFKKIGRNQATTFTGLCKEHDRQLFLPIDIYQFDVSNEEQKFLIAYRSVLRELHTRIKAAIDLQNFLNKSVELGKSDPNKADELMWEATVAIANSCDFYQYKLVYDNIYNSNLFTKIEHNYIRIENRNCPLAVSSLFNPIKSITLMERPKPKFIAINVFPQEKDTIILFSYMVSHQEDLRPYTNEIINASGEYQLYLLSKTILKYCENFVISPEHFNVFSQQKIDAIKDFYLTTATQIDHDRDDEDLMLF